MSTIVRLDRSTDRERPCCENLATLRPGKGPHGAAATSKAPARCAGGGLRVAPRSCASSVLALNRGRLRFGLGVGGCRCQSLRAVGSVISGIYLDRVLLDCIGLQFVTRRFLGGNLLAD
jgi:hypothetical protein